MNKSKENPFGDCCWANEDVGEMDDYSAEISAEYERLNKEFNPPPEEKRDETFERCTWETGESPENMMEYSYPNLDNKLMFSKFRGEFDTWYQHPLIQHEGQIIPFEFPESWTGEFTVRMVKSFKYDTRHYAREVIKLLLQQ